MATKSFSRDIIVKSSRAAKLLRTSMNEGPSKSSRPIPHKGSRTVSDTQVKRILCDF